MISGVNHVTLAVTDLERSLAFYRDVVGLRPRVRWPRGAHLEAGTLWLCLTLDAATRPAGGYTHLALTTTDAGLEQLRARVPAERLWQEDTSEGASLYFLDPDGHRLEAHVGSLDTRLAALRERPYEGLRWLGD